MSLINRAFQADNIGPFRVASTNGAKYFAIFVDVKESFAYHELNNDETGFPSKFIRNALEYYLSHSIIA